METPTCPTDWTLWDRILRTSAYPHLLLCADDYSHSELLPASDLMRVSSLEAWSNEVRARGVHLLGVAGVLDGKIAVFDDVCTA